MARYNIKNALGESLDEESFEDFIKSFWGKDYYKAFFKSDQEIENRMYLLKDNGENACRIDTHFHRDKTIMVISDIKKKGIESLLKGSKDIILDQYR